ncbi:hypothetical protein E2320_012913, partial [Naja naja]
MAHWKVTVIGGSKRGRGISLVKMVLSPSRKLIVQSNNARLGSCTMCQVIPSFRQHHPAHLCHEIILAIFDFFFYIIHSTKRRRRQLAVISTAQESTGGTFKSHVCCCVGGGKNLSLPLVSTDKILSYLFFFLSNGGFLYRKEMAGHFNLSLTILHKTKSYIKMNFSSIRVMDVALTTLCFKVFAKGNFCLLFLFKNWKSLMYRGREGAAVSSALLCALFHRMSFVHWASLFIL